MDVFAVHERLLADYRAFTSGFVEVRDPRIRAHVEQELADGVQWPDPWLERYEAMAEAAATAVSYETVLDPPPGHGPRHPAR